MRIPQLAPLHSPGFFRLWSSSLVWYFGRWMDVLLASWLALELTDSAWAVALIGFYRSVPVTAFGAFGGAVADRIDRRTLVIVAGMANCVASFSVAYLYLAGSLAYWHLAAANVLLGLAWAVDFPTRRAMVPDLVARQDLLPAMVLDTISMNVSRAAGPLMGGGLLATISIPHAYIVLGLIYASDLLPLLGLRLPARSSTRAMPVVRYLAQGLRYCQKSPPVRGVLLITLLMNALAFPYTQILAVFARDVLLVGPVELGLLAAADGLGSLVGAAVLMGMARLRRYGLVFALCSAGMCLALLVFAVSSVFVISLAALIVAGMAHAGFSTLQSTITLGSVSDELRGRVMGVVTLAIGGSTIGMLLVGGLAGALGAPLAVGLMSVTGATLIGGTAVLSPGLLSYRGAPSPRRATTTVGGPASAR